MSLTGRLGTPNSQPGQILLGGPGTASPTPPASASVGSQSTQLPLARPRQTVNSTWIWTSSLVLPGLARVSQIAVESLEASSPSAQLSQVTTEALTDSTSSAKLSQLATEALTASTPSAQLSQIVIEALIATPTIRTVPLSSALKALGITRTIPITSRFGGGQSIIPLTAWFLKTVDPGSTIPLSVQWLNGRRTIPLGMALSGRLKRTIPLFVLMAPPGFVWTITRTIPIRGTFIAAGGGLRTIPLTGQFRRTIAPRIIPLTAWIGNIRTIPISTPLKRTFSEGTWPGRIIPLSGSIGLRREIPLQGQFRGGTTRTIPLSGAFGQPHRTIPIGVSFWKPVATWQVWSGTTYALAPPPTAWQPNTFYQAGQQVHPTITTNGHIYTALVSGTSGTTEPLWPIGSGATVVDGSIVWREAGVMPPPPATQDLSATTGMSQASNVVGGSTFLLDFTNTPGAINAPPPADATFPGGGAGWPHPVSQQGGYFVPWPSGDKRVQSLNFDWRYPTPGDPLAPINPTGDIAISYFPSVAHGQEIWTDPWDEQIMWRIVVGLPNDPAIVAGMGDWQIALGCVGFLSRIFSVTFNGFDAPLAHWDENWDISAALIGTWTLPSSYMRPGDNVIGVTTGTYLGYPGNLFSRKFEYLLTANYRTIILKRKRFPQVIG